MQESIYTELLNENWRMTPNQLHLMRALEERECFLDTFAYIVK